MKKTHTFLFIIFFISIFCHAKIKTSLSLSPHIGFTFGQFDEILYAPDETMCSLLEWEQKPLLNLGLSANLDLNNFSITADFDYGTQIANPQMYDSDWSDGIKYSYTIHPLESSREINTQFKIAYNIFPHHSISLFPEIEIKYMYASFNAGRGAGIRNDRQIKVYGVDYTRHSLFFFTGLKFSTNLNSFTTIDTDFMVAPYIYQYATDFHHGVKNPFTSIEIQNGFFSKFKINTALSFKCTNNFTIDLYTNFLFGRETKGSFYSNYYTEEITKFTDQQTGSKIFSAKFGIATTFKIF